MSMSGYNEINAIREFHESLNMGLCIAKWVQKSCPRHKMRKTLVDIMDGEGGRTIIPADQALVRVKRAKHNSSAGPGTLPKTVVRAILRTFSIFSQPQERSSPALCVRA